MPRLSKIDHYDRMDCLTCKEFVSVDNRKGIVTCKVRKCVKEKKGGGDEKD